MQLPNFILLFCFLKCSQHNSYNSRNCFSHILCIFKPWQVFWDWGSPNVRGGNEGSSVQESPMDLLGGKSNMVWQCCPIAPRIGTCKGKKTIFCPSSNSVWPENLYLEAEWRYQNSVLERCNTEWSPMVSFLCFVYPTSVSNPIPSKW